MKNTLLKNKSPKNKRIQVTLYPKVYEMAVTNAKNYGLPLGEYIRFLITDPGHFIFNKNSEGYPEEKMSVEDDKRMGLDLKEAFEDVKNGRMTPEMGIEELIKYIKK